MIKFFRKIRQTLLLEGNIGKYLKYGIGEILLVVIGILIAIQINNWNTNRTDRIQEQQILKQLKEEYLDNRDQLQTKIDVRNIMSSSALALLEYKSNPAKHTNIDSFNLFLVQTMFRPTFDPALGVTNELINSGKLYLIGNQNLRKSISDWSGKYFNELEEEEQIVFDYIRNIYHPYVVDKYSIRNVFSQIENSQVWKDVHLDNGGDTFFSRFKLGNDQLANISNLLSDYKFENHLFTIMAWNDSANIQSKGIMNKMNEILEMIEDEIDDK